MPVLSNLRQIKYSLTATGVAALMFDLNYYVMSVFPGSRNNMCMMGANLTPLNIGFSIVLSAMIGILIAGLIALFSQKYQQKRAALTSLSGLGFFVGALSVICTVCTLPVISLFGLTIWLDLFTHYETAFKVLSLGLIGGALFLLNSQLSNACAVCAPQRVNPVS